MKDDMMPPKGPPAESGATPAEQADGAGQRIADAMQGAGALKPLEDLISEEGLDISATDMLKYAQDIPELHGKSPEDIASAIREKPELADEIVEAANGEAADESESPKDDYDTVKARHMKAAEAEPEDGDDEAGY